MTKHNPSRRAFVKKAAYVAPAVLSLQAFSALAKSGSNKDEKPGPKPGKKPPKRMPPPKPTKKRNR